jgi:hypothetical protein
MELPQDRSNKNEEPNGLDIMERISSLSIGKFYLATT